MNERAPSIEKVEKMSAANERLRSERERLRMSQEEFGKAAGVTKRTQVNYESGERSPDMQYLENIARIGADVPYIVVGTRSIRMNEHAPSAVVETNEKKAPVYKLPEPQAGLLTEKEVCSVVLDALFNTGRALPAAKVWAIVDAAMALQRGGITVDKSTLHEQLRLIK